ncbi:MAG: hypothetical protein MJZ89_06600, partial [Paludibacteraceae bacterium]|nr:hypothetical protein [Paludibacteraceae bacterium]
MKTRLTLLFASLIMVAFVWSARADETITVRANDSEISAQLDLKAVATIFGEAKDLEAFEQALNTEENHISNLDLNGDGAVDYLRVVEAVDSKNSNQHLVLIQAVLAKDIFQDVASIYVERDENNNEVAVQVVGDVYIYGENYVVEPTYLYRPIIYDWFWSPYWTCYYSPWYWDYWPHWYHHYTCWAIHDYWSHVHAFHHHHHYCSFRYAPEPRAGYRNINNQISPQRRNDYARQNPERAFASRNASRTTTSGSRVSNARDLQVGSRQSASRAVQGNNSTRSASVDRTYGSRVGTSNTRVVSTASSSRSEANSGSRTSNATTSRNELSRGNATSSSRNSATVTRSTGNTTTARTSTAATATRSSGSATRSTSTTTASTTRSSATRTTTTQSVSRPSSSSSSVSRSTSSQSVSR